ncbi:MAG: hypothetical protein N3G74_02560 [Candidatus Micrarchaeota archaeon]|nr:hypothetical protein [Candidatus Micrarchaeota archaeon]
MKKPKRQIPSKQQVEIIEAGLKTKFISYLMLILASSIVLWFTMFSDIALIAWIAVAIIGGYIILNYDLFVSKVLVVLSAVAMEFVVLSSFTNLLVWGSPGNILLLAFIVLDIILIYALSKV